MLTKWGLRLTGVHDSENSNRVFLPKIIVTNNSVAFIEAKTIGGITKYVSPYIYCNIGTMITGALVESGSNASYGIAFGSGDTAPTENDYTLESQVTGISAVLNPGSVQTIFDDTLNRYVARLGIDVTNNTGDSVIIREIGLFYRINPADSVGGTPDTANSNRHCFMADRTVLSEPITIANGATGSIQYDFAY